MSASQSGAYEVSTICVKEGTGLTLSEGSQAFYQRTESRQQHGTWHYFVILRPSPSADSAPGGAA